MSIPIAHFTVTDKQHANTKITPSRWRGQSQPQATVVTMVMQVRRSTVLPLTSTIEKE